MTLPASTKTAWVQLYEARRPVSEPPARTPGRPPSAIPRRKIGLTLSQAEIVELERWQVLLSDIAGRHVSSGETVGILTRICSTWLAQQRLSTQYQSLSEFVDYIILNRRIFSSKNRPYLRKKKIEKTTMPGSMRKVARRGRAYKQAASKVGSS